MRGGGRRRHGSGVWVEGVRGEGGREEGEGGDEWGRWRWVRENM